MAPSIDLSAVREVPGQEVEIMNGSYYVRKGCFLFSSDDNVLIAFLIISSAVLFL